MKRIVLSACVFFMSLGAALFAPSAPAALEQYFTQYHKEYESLAQAPSTSERTGKIYECLARMQSALTVMSNYVQQNPAKAREHARAIAQIGESLVVCECMHHEEEFCKQVESARTYSAELIQLVNKACRSCA